MIRINYYFVIIIITFIFSCQTESNESDTQQVNIETKLDSLLTAHHENGLFQGSILISKRDSILYQNGFGRANKKKNNSAETVHKLASITKSITAALILKLYEKGYLDIHNPIFQYINTYEKEVGNKITIMHLLTHSSGIPNYTELPGSGELHQQEVSPEDLVNFFSDKPLEFEPGSKFKYSNSGYALLGLIAEEVTSTSYSQLLNQYIFEPLDMSSSSYFDPSTFSTLSYSDPGNAIIAGGINMSVPYAAGGIQSTVFDMYKFQKSLLDDSFLADSLQRLIFKPNKGDYAMGWFITNAPSFTNPEESMIVAEHGGSMPGYTTQMTKILNDDIFIISLNNISGAQLFPLHIKIAELLYRGELSQDDEMELIQVQ